MTTKIKSGVISDNAITSAHISSGAISSSHLTGIDTDAISEGSSNLYFTTARVDSHLSGGTGVTYSSGAISIGQSVATSASPTFANLTLTGNLNITGDVDSVSVTDLDVTDKTITVGVGGTASANDGAGLVVDGASASILWDNSNGEWDINKPINVTGRIVATGISQFADVNIPDNNAIRFGSSQDLQIYHDGSYSYIREVGTGDLRIAGASNVQIWNSDIDSQMANFANGGAVTLYYGGNPKLATTSTGIDITGTLNTSSSVTMDTSVASGAFLTDATIYPLRLTNDDTTAGNAVALTFGQGGFDFTNFIASVRTGTGDNPKGDLVFGGRPSDGTAFLERMRIQADGQVGIGTTSPNTTLTLSDGTDEFDFGVTANQLLIKSVTSDGSDDQRIIIDAGNGGLSSTRGAYIALSGNEASTEPGHAIYQMGNVTGSSHVFRKAGGTDAVTIDSSGRVGIATSTNHAGSALGYGLTIDSEGSSGSGLEIHRTGNSRFELYQNSSGGQYLDALGTTPFMVIATGGSERMRIDSSGNVIIGSQHDGAPGLTIEESKNLSFGTGNDNESYVNFFRQSSSAAAIMATGYRRSSTANKMESSVASSWAKSAVGAYYDGIRFYADIASADSVGTTLTPTERMRITSDGKVGIGTTPSTGLHVVTAGGTTPFRVQGGANSGVNIMEVGYAGGGAGANFIVDDNGRVGIGTDNPSETLHVKPGHIFLDGSSSSVNPSIQWEDDSGFGTAGTKMWYGNADGYQYYDSYWSSGGGHRFRTSLASSTIEALTIQHNGNVGIGTTSPSDYYATSLVVSAPSEKGITIASTATNVWNYIMFADGTSGDARYRGYIGYNHNNDTMEFGSAGQQAAYIDSTRRLNVGGNFAHSTYAHAAVFSKNSTPLGTVVIEDSDVSSGIGNTVLNCYLRDQDPATFAVFVKFTDGGGTVGSITHNDDGGGVTYNTTSDYRLKENVNYDWDGLSLLNQLKPAKFNFIRQPSKTLQGFLAHEVKDIVPSSVQGDKDHMEPTGTVTDSDGNVVYENVYEHFCKTDEGQTWTRTGEEPVYQELDYSRLVPLLTKAIQELNTKLEAAEARITELEG